MGWLLSLLLAVSPGLPGYTWPAPDSRAPIRAVVSNGRLTVDIDGTGRLAGLRWPSLGYWEHIDSRPEEGAEGAPWGNGYWVIVSGGQPECFDSAAWTITHAVSATEEATTEYRERDGTRRAVQQLRVSPAGDLLTIDLELYHFGPDCRVYWYQAFSPATSVIRGTTVPYNDILPGTGFATYYDDTADILVQFRPDGADRDSWQMAREFAARGGLSTDRPRFGPGVYLGTFAPGGLESGFCAPAPGEISRLLEGSRPGTAAHFVSGRACGLLGVGLHPGAGGGARATICVGAAMDGPSLYELRRRRIQAHGVDEAPGRPAGPGPATGPARDLLACQDADTGAVVRGLVGRPPMTHAAVFDSIWASAALDRLGYRDRAGRALAFHIRSVRAAFLPEGPPGSLPAYLHLNDEPATNVNGANPATTAWLLAGMWRHTAVTMERVAPAWEGPLLDCGDFLARAPEAGGVLAGVLSPDSLSLAQLQLHYLGLLSAKSLLESLGRDEPAPWQGRREELYARIRFRQLNGGEGGDSGWIDRWVRALPEGAVGDEAPWQILQTDAPHATKQLRDFAQGPLGVHPDTPRALDAALNILFAAE